MGGLGLLELASATMVEASVSIACAALFVFAERATRGAHYRPFAGLTVKSVVVGIWVGLLLAGLFALVGIFAVVFAILAVAAWSHLCESK
jgi:tetrahydromethanopterin S-methyltransferase subunit B